MSSLGFCSHNFATCAQAAQFASRNGLLLALSVVKSRIQPGALILGLVDMHPTAAGSKWRCHCDHSGRWSAAISPHLPPAQHYGSRFRKLWYNMPQGCQLHFLVFPYAYLRGPSQLAIGGYYEYC